jgi:chromosome segregation ATPase
MGTMYGAQRPSLSEEAVTSLVHPHTGAPLRPLGVRKDGRPMWPIMGASPDDDPDGGDTGSGGTDNTDDDDDDDPEGDSKDSKDSDKGTDKDGDPEAKIAALEDEKKRHVRRRQEAEKERDELRTRLEALEAKDTPELEQLQKKTTQLESEVSTLSSALSEARLQVAFLQDNTYAWHNPGRALKLADLSEVEIDDDGTVTGLKSALDKLAKTDSYLIKTEGEKQKEKPPSTDDAKNPSKKEKTGDKAKEAEKALLKKYPALRR